MHLFFSILTGIFIIGLAGSLVVAIMAFIGDVEVFFEKDAPPAKPDSGQRPQLSFEKSHQ